MNNRPILTCLVLCITTMATWAARDLVQLSGVRGGLVAVVDCPGVLGELKVDDKYLVQGLFRDARSMAGARASLESAGVYGRITVRQWDGAALPYIDNLVNLVIADDPSAVSTREILRVLVPRGVLLTKKKINGATAAGDGWYKLTKPWPKTIDEWTHWLHAPDNNAVSNDASDEIPLTLQWVQEPRWLKSHNLAPPFNAMVTAGGRLFYIVDETAAGFQGMPDRWRLVARDAFNGKLLWKRPITEWGEKYYMPGGRAGDGSNKGHPRTQSPQQVLRRLVAVGDKVFVTLGLYSPVTMLDAATGKTLKTFAGTENAFEILCADGRLYLAINRGLKKDAPDPEIVIAAVDIQSGKTLWTTGAQRAVMRMGFTLPQYVDVYLTLGAEGLFFVSDKGIVALDPNSGSPRWTVSLADTSKKKNRKKKDSGGSNAVLVYHDGVLIVGKGGGSGLQYFVYDASTGKQLWTKPAGALSYRSPVDIFVVQGLLWSLHYKEDRYDGLGLRTGEVKRSVNTAVLKEGNTHPNCYRNKAATNFFFFGKNKGVDYINVNDKAKSRSIRWVKGQCRYGVMPANGMLYAPSHFCTCSARVKFNGMTALSRNGIIKPPAPSTDAQVVKGPAFETVSASTKPSPDDWPAYRRNNLRTAYQPKLMADKLTIKWCVQPGRDLTPPTIAAGKLFVSSQAEQKVVCLDAATGQVRWTFPVEGRVNSPPTFAKGRLVFGSAGGFVYCLDAATGALAWRFRAAPLDRQICAWGQIESVWPVFGSVLVENDYVFCSAGRNSSVDHGIYLYKLDLRTGRPLKAIRHINGAGHGETERGVTADLLVGSEGAMHMRGLPFDMNTLAVKDEKNGSRIVAKGGFLDDSFFNGAAWDCGKFTANILCTGGEDVYGVRIYQGYHFKSASHHNFLAAQGRIQLVRGSSRGRTDWSVKIPILAKSLIVGGRNVYLAGVEDKRGERLPWSYYDGDNGAILSVHSKSGGALKSQLKLKSAPVYDGMAAAGNYVFLCCKDGSVLCFEQAR